MKYLSKDFKLSTVMTINQPKVQNAGGSGPH